MLAFLRSFSFSSGKMTEKHRSKRASTLSIYFLLYPVVHAGTPVKKAGSRNPQSGRRWAAGNLCEEILQRFVSLRGHEFEPDLLYVKSFEKVTQTGMFNSAREGATTHDPGINMHRFAVQTAQHYCDLA
jgi:hypothetical protein